MTIRPAAQPTAPKTLLDFANVAAASFDPDAAALVLVDYQAEYVTGTLALPGAAAALAAARDVLGAFRAAGAPVFHVVHHAVPGGALFDPEGPHVAIADPLAPAAGERVVVKSLPNAFARTTLEQELRATGRGQLVIIGFMTHMCVDSTARAASELGFRTLVHADACATRDLPHPTLPATRVPAAEVHRNALAALADRFATVVTSLPHPAEGTPT